LQNSELIAKFVTSKQDKTKQLTKLKKKTMHVGNRIREVLDEQGRSAIWLASKIPCERTNMYDIFKRKDVSVALLYKVSSILGHDFFLELSEELRKQQTEASPYSFSASAKGAKK